MKSYKVKTTLELEAYINAEDHDHVKRELTEHLIKTGFKHVVIIYIKSETVKEEDETYASVFALHQL